MSGVFQNNDPHPLSTQLGCPPAAQKAGGTHSPGSEGVGVNILEDARHWIGLLQYNLSTIKSIELGPPTSRAFFFPLTTEAMNMRSPAPRPAHRSFADPSDNILGSIVCTGATKCPNFFPFSLFYSFLIFFFLFSPYFSLFFFIHIFLSFSSYSLRTILRLLILLSLYLNLFVVLQTCILII